MHATTRISLLQVRTL